MHDKVNCMYQFYRIKDKTVNERAFGRYVASLVSFIMENDPGASIIVYLVEQKPDKELTVQQSWFWNQYSSVWETMRELPPPICVQEVACDIMDGFPAWARTKTVWFYMDDECAHGMLDREFKGFVQKQLQSSVVVRVSRLRMQDRLVVETERFDFIDDVHYPRFTFVNRPLEAHPEPLSRAMRLAYEPL